MEEARFESLREYLSDQCEELASDLAEDLEAHMSDLHDAVADNFRERIEWAIKTCGSGLFEYGPRYLNVRIKYLGDDNGYIHFLDSKMIKRWWAMEQALCRNTEEKR
jgi:hypothetical protein